MEIKPHFSVDALVIGSGLAGLNFALNFVRKLPNKKVLIACKDSQSMHATTAYAQGGIASVFSAEDNSDSHIADTIRAGAGLCNEEAVKVCVEEGPARIQDLIESGVKFDRNKNSYDLTREGGHSKRRVFHVADQTGKAILKSLVEQVESHPNIILKTDAIAVDFITDQKLSKKIQASGATCIGAYFLDVQDGKVFSVSSKVTMLASGGASKVYKYTSNPDSNNGDGIAMAHRLGAHIANMEFTQFHPTCLFHPEAKNTLLSEALRGEGAILVDKNGNRFMEKYHPQKELAPRDVVSLSIDKELKLSGHDCVYLDISHKDKDFILSHFPHNYQTCLRFGFDLTSEAIPVVPAAHYTCGGVMTDLYGRTNIHALYAAGEVSHTGLHGANRLASNSLLEAVVFSYRAAENAAESIQNTKTLDDSYPELPAWDPGFAKDGEEEVIIKHNWEEIRAFMWNYVGIVRTNKRLEYAARRIELLKQEIRQNYWDRSMTKNLIELRNLITVADLIVCSAKLRKESRALHQNLDYPETNNKLFVRDTII